MAYTYVPYPRWITPKDGSPRKIVHSAEEETAETGVLMNPDGTVAEQHEPEPDVPAPTENPVAEPAAEGETPKAAEAW